MDFNAELLKLQTEKKIIFGQIQEKRGILESEQRKYADHVQARWVLNEVSRTTQEHLKENLENLVNVCINEVFPNSNFNFQVDLKIKANKMACEFFVLVNDEPLSPKDEMGGSILDIIGTALKVILWSIEEPKSRNLIIMDEPFRFTGKLITKAGAMIKELSHRLGIQFIINTHSDELIDIADRSWHVASKNGKSIVTMTKG